MHKNHMNGSTHLILLNLGHISFWNDDLNKINEPTNLMIIKSNSPSSLKIFSWPIWKRSPYQLCLESSNTRWIKANYHLPNKIKCLVNVEMLGILLSTDLHYVCGLILIVPRHLKSWYYCGVVFWSHHRCC